MILSAVLFFVFFVVFCAGILLVLVFLFPVLRDRGKTIDIPFFDFDPHSKIAETVLDSKAKESFASRKRECKILRAFYDEHGKDLIALYNVFSECASHCPRFARSSEDSRNAAWECALKQKVES